MLLGDAGRLAQQQFSPQFVPHMQLCAESSTSDADTNELPDTKVVIASSTAIETTILRASSLGIQQQLRCGIRRKITRHPRAWFKPREIMEVRTALLQAADKVVCGDCFWHVVQAARLSVSRKTQAGRLHRVSGVLSRHQSTHGVMNPSGAWPRLVMMKLLMATRSRVAKV